MPTDATPDDADAPAGLLPRAAGAAVLAVALAFLAAWLAGSAAWAGPRMKTNTALSLALLGAALLLRASGARGSRRDRAGCALAALAAAVGAASLAEYALGVDLGIDQLLARDAIVPESARFPNRMSPNAALGLALAGVALAASRGRRAAWAVAAQVADGAVLLVGLAALLGYLYGARMLYQPTSYIRMSPFTAGALALLGVGTLALRPGLGVARLLTSGEAAGFVARRLLALSVAAPVLFGWLWLEAQRRALYGAAEGAALMVIGVVGAFGGVVLLLAYAVDLADARRRLIEADLRLSNDLASELARASAVGEVVAAALRHAPAALDTTFASVLLREGQRLEHAASAGYAPEEVRSFPGLPLDVDYPATVAQRAGAPVFVGSRVELLRRFPVMAGAPLGRREAWAALPLKGREETRGVLWLGYDTPRAFDAAERERMERVASSLGLALDRAMLHESEQRARARAEEASRTKDEFLALLGHELRNPLAPIATSLQLMKLRSPDAFERERAVIERQVEHMTRLVGDLLDVARITRGKVELKLQRVELGEVFAGAVETASALLEEKRHRLHAAVPARGLPVMADAHRLAQVISNLLTNAAKYTDPGGLVTVTAARDGDDVVLSVKDNGMGIPAALLPRVFEQFVQGERTLDRSRGGLGLGLSIARSLVEQHGGAISARSEGPRQGSEFVVRLPLDLSRPITDIRPPPAPPPPAPGVTRARVLVVDDNLDAADLFAEALRADGHDVRAAYDGPGGLQAADGFAPEVAFVDIGLPVMDGYELARRLREAPTGPRLFLVAITGYGQDSDRERSRAAGFDLHLVKPVDLDRVLAIAAGRERASKPAPA
ncbi:MAG: ATP-binding protein [Polyangiales bacterium]